MEIFIELKSIESLNVSNSMDISISGSIWSDSTLFIKRVMKKKTRDNKAIQLTIIKNL